MDADVVRDESGEGRMRLGELALGARAEIVALDEHPVQTTLHEGELERRLIEMGFVEGALVEVLHQGFPRRDPVAIRVSEHTVALRRAEANAVVVCLLPHGDG